MVKALELGATDILPRPIDVEELSARARTQIRRKRYSDFLREKLDNSLEMAVTDALTGLHNRRYMAGQLQALVNRAVHGGSSVAVLLMDIDHFKSVTDQWGHGVGDEVLKFVARTLTANARPFDVYGRWGGEEFAGIIRCIGEKDLERLGNRLRRLIETAFVVHAGARISVTVSIGATLFRADDTVESLVRRADELLYRSKHEGRNRLTLG